MRTSLSSLSAWAVLLLSLAGAPAHAETCNTTPSGSTNILCYDMATYPVWAYSFLAVPGNYAVSTSDLKNIPGQSNVVDTVVQILNVNTGAVIAVDDDDGPGQYDSYAAFTVTSTTTVRVVVAGWDTGRQGTCDIRIQRDGYTAYYWNDQWFGGWRMVMHEVRAPDRILVGVARWQTDPTLFANRLLVFSSSNLNCDSGCGSFVEGTNEVSLLSRADVPFSSFAGHVLVGSALPTSAVSTRMFHHRSATGWGSATIYQDLDGDGLTNELESLSNPTDAQLTINTCDSATGPSPDCSGGAYDFSARAGFHASDTDNDGLKDGWEVFGVRKQCDQTALAPYYDPGPNGCSVDATWVPCTGPCHSSPLSALGTDPREFDSLIHMDSEDDGAGGNHFLNVDERDWLEHVLSEEGLECFSNVSTDPADCPGELGAHYQVRVALHDGQVFPNNENTDTNVWVVNSHYNRNMPTFRKFTRTHRYMLLQHQHGGGVTSGTNPRLTVVSEGGDRAAALAHEHGHQLGLEHGGFEDHDGCEPRNNKANYPSLMNYSYAWAQSRKNQQPGGQPWPDEVGAGCNFDDDCPQTGNCDDHNQGVRRCWLERDQWQDIRFSRGLLADLAEVQLTETPLSSLQAAAVYAYNPLDNTIPVPVPQDPFSACCTTPTFACTGLGNCKADWNRNGWTQTGTVCANLNWFQDERSAAGCNPGTLDDDPDCSSQNPVGDTFQDSNDWLSIYDLGRNSLSTALFETDLRVYASNFDLGHNSELDPTDYSGWVQTVQNFGVLTEPSLSCSNLQCDYQEAGAFEGPGTGDRVVISAHDSIRSLGQPFQGHGARGFRADAFFRADDFQTGSGHQIFDSAMFQVDIIPQPGNTGKARVWLHDGTIWRSLTSARTLWPDAWYWVVAGYDVAENPADWHEGRLWLLVIRWDTVDEEWDFPNGTCDRACVAKVADRAPQAVTIGQYATDSSWAMKGLIDEPMIFNRWNGSRFGIDAVPGCPTAPCP